MGSKELKLLGGWFSPFVNRVQIALNLKGLDYENIEEALIPKSNLLLQSNPVYKKIPVLFHQHKILSESAIIIEYIDEIWNSNAPSILPSNAYDRANARFWVTYIDHKWYSSIKSSILAKDDEAKKSSGEQVEEVLVRLEDLLKKYSEGKPFFGGDEIGFIDIAFGCFLSWLRVVEKIIGKKVLDETKFPSLAKWAQDFAAHPAVKGVLPETDNLFEFAKVYFGLN